MPALAILGILLVLPVMLILALLGLAFFDGFVSGPLSFKLFVGCIITAVAFFVISLFSPRR